MNTTLYFLRSSEQKIVTDMLFYAMRLNEVNKTLQEIPSLSMYEQFYGFTNKDLGLYVLADNQVAGAVWTRQLSTDHLSNGFVDDRTPILNIAVIPKYRGEGIGSAMIEQFLLEAGALHEKISVSVVRDSAAVRFYERHGFIYYDNGFEEKSPVDGSHVVTMIKHLSIEAVKRPTDGYDPRRWMD